MEQYLVCEIPHNLNPSRSYKLASNWLHESIHMVIVGFNTSWSSQITRIDVSSYLSNLQISYEQYKSTFRRLFELDNVDNFKLIFEDGTLKWLKVLNEEVSVTYGSFTFNLMASSEDLSERVEPFLQHFITLREKVEVLQQECLKVKNESAMMSQCFYKSNQDKLNLENDLYKRFLKLLQKKDVTIQKLTSKISARLRNLKKEPKEHQGPKPSTSKDS